ncbi:MAG TPA: prolyl oligopeptidase family serine peptidase [Ignavibacteria bacterium]|nr:prolyl oligopeptidase family serine peptidase [Ignavibacteria bacterium]
MSKVDSDIISSRKVIDLPEKNRNMIRSGWGDEIIDNTIVEKIVYDNDGEKIDGYLAYPKDLSKKYPLVIWNRGGSRKSGYIDEFLARGMFGEIASWGYVVLASMYRDKDEFGGKDVTDVIKLFDIADDLEACDSSKIGMEGWSRGGMMTFKVLTMTDRVKACVIISGLTDLVDHAMMQDTYRRIFGTESEEIFNQRKKEKSPLYFADEINTDAAILMIHGTEDDDVEVRNSTEMYEKLKGKVKNIEIVLLDGGDHYLKKFRKETVKLRKEWFRKYLG